MRALATTLKVIGAIAAVPSICRLVLFGVHAMGRRLARPPTGDMNVGSNPDAILLILKGIAKAFGVLGRIGGAVEGFVVSVLAAPCRS